MDAAQALADLTEISSQIETALVLDADGSTMARRSTDRGRRSSRVPRRSCSRPCGVDRRRRGRERRPARDRHELAAASSSSTIDGRTIAATTGPEPTVGLVFYDLKSCLRSVAAEEKPKPKRRAARRRRGGAMPRPRRRLLDGLPARRRLARGHDLLPSPLARRRERVDVYFDDGSMVSLAEGSPEAATVLPLARRFLDDRTALSRGRRRRSSPRCASTPTSRATSSSARASGRATTSTSTASRRVPDLLEALGSGSPPRSRELEPDAVRLAAPELGAVALAAAASLASRLAVPDRAQRGEGLRNGEPPRGRIRRRRAGRA